MTFTEDVQLLSAIGTIALSIAAYLGLIYPYVHLKRIKPIFVITIDPIDEGKKGMNFSIFNVGKSSAHQTTAILKMIDAKTGYTLGQWFLPWKMYSQGFLDMGKGLTEAKYDPITIYPGQRADLRAFEVINIHGNQLMGLNAPPYLMGHDAPPAVFWSLGLSPHTTSIQANLQVNHAYVVYISLYCDELSEGTVKMFVIQWDEKRIIPDRLELELDKRDATEIKLRRDKSKPLIKKEKEDIKRIARQRRGRK